MTSEAPKESNFFHKNPSCTSVSNDFVQSGIMWQKNGHVNSVTFDIFGLSAWSSLKARVISFNDGAPREASELHEFADESLGKAYAKLRVNKKQNRYQTRLHV